MQHAVGGGARHLELFVRGPSQRFAAVLASAVEPHILDVHIRRNFKAETLSRVLSLGGAVPGHQGAVMSKMVGQGWRRMEDSP